MNENRVRAILQSQSSVAQKVFSFVPLSESWPATKIAAELNRQTGSFIDRRILDGCLLSLSESGIVKESPRGFFRAMAQKATPATVEKKEVKVKEVTQKAISQDKLDPMDRFAAVAAILRKAADEIEDAAMAAGQRSETAEAAGAQFGQLKALLKNITV